MLHSTLIDLKLNIHQVIIYTITYRFSFKTLTKCMSPVIKVNCIFTGDTASYYGNYSGILGYTRMNYGGIKISNCYAAKQSLGTKISEDKFSVAEYINCYSSGGKSIHLDNFFLSKVASGNRVNGDKNTKIDAPPQLFLKQKPVIITVYWVQ